MDFPYSVQNLDVGIDKETREAQRRPDRIHTPRAEALSTIEATSATDVTTQTLSRCDHIVSVGHCASSLSARTDNRTISRE
jgi:hypothetical protein